MKDVIYVTGHKNPDTDSICSALAYAEFKNRIGSTTAIPIRLGEVSRETQFALDYFGVTAPELMPTLKCSVSDLDFDNTAPISSEISLKMAWSIMKKYNVKTLPIVDDDGKLKGIASVSNLTSTYMDIWDNNILAKSNTKVENIIDTLAAKTIYLSEKDPKFPGKILVVAMQPSSAEEHIEEGDIVICGDRKDAQTTIIDSKASLMIIAGNHTVSDEILKKAKDSKVSIISTPYDSFTASRLIVQSIPIGYVMQSKDIVYFRTSDLVEDIKDVMLKTRYRSYPVIDADEKVVGSISRYHLISQHKKKVILVDHNEMSQAIDGLQDAEILEIIDHHRIGGMQTGNPIYFRNQPVGCSSTIIASIFFENGIRPSKKAAGLMASAIISDTLLFKSPTTTPVDREILKRLCEIANIDAEKYASEMFKAGTSLDGKTVEEIFNQDYKIFKIAGKKVGVSQVSTMDLEGFEKYRKEMFEYMNKKANDEQFDVLLLLLTDILKEASLALAAGSHKDVVGKAFNVVLKEDSAYLPGVLSRKKQVIPPLTSTIEALNEK
ncbi:putative manganese-dependent inorganic diphosphatase [Clostridium guangxiense]|uniref:putative manganese-dependent inorganic diphosphatase n=1 Tax=Clostridium guangxiense TaxID=1662055 RepID=UPI001E352F58|nr:putative manganese-dependent inorganic diphosphatase [Clostridium guangxiense]MCD2345210.1 putative manganese-dependent inorganic diphosphatase [Clostridium guangxiense]